MIAYSQYEGEREKEFNLLCSAECVWPKGHPTYICSPLQNFEENLKFEGLA
jgi:hypothetical protein